MVSIVLALANIAITADPTEWARSGRPSPEREFLQPPLDNALDLYEPCGTAGRLEGTVPPILVNLVAQWISAFNLREPGVHVTTPPPYLPPQGELNPRLRAFFEGHLDFAFVTREMLASDLAEFRRAHGFDPLQLPVSGGSYRHFGFVDAMVVIVNDSNPLRGLSLEQLDAIFSRTRHRGHHAAVKTWDEVGVRTWPGEPVRVVGSGAWVGQESARATFFRQRVMDYQGRRGEWRKQDGLPDTGDDAVVAAVAADPLAIGFTAAGHLAPGVRAIAIGSRDDSSMIEPTYENVARADYPLSRVFYLVVALAPGQSLPPALDAFVRFLLSRDGQQVVLSHGVFLPLRASQADATRRMLPARSCMGDHK